MRGGPRAIAERDEGLAGTCRPHSDPGKVHFYLVYMLGSHLRSSLKKALH